MRIRSGTPTPTPMPTPTPIATRRLVLAGAGEDASVAVPFVPELAAAAAAVVVVVYVVPDTEIAVVTVCSVAVLFSPAKPRRDPPVGKGKSSPSVEEQKVPLPHHQVSEALQGKRLAHQGDCAGVALSAWISGHKTGGLMKEEGMQKALLWRGSRKGSELAKWYRNQT